MNENHHSHLAPVDSFSISGPLSIIDPGERHDYFRECEIAHVNYVGHRSKEAPENTVTYHAVTRSGDVAGFISFRIALEDSQGAARIFVSIEYIYIMQKFRMRGLSRLLVSPLIREVQTVLHATRGSRPKTHLHSASHATSVGGVRVLRALEQQLLDISKRYVGVVLIGRYHEHPPGVTQRLWAPEKILTSGG